MSKVELNQNYVPKRTIQQLPDWGDKTSVSICPSVSGHNKLTIPHNPKSGLENNHFCVYIFNRTVPAGIFLFSYYSEGFEMDSAQWYRCAFTEGLLHFKSETTCEYIKKHMVFSVHCKQLEMKLAIGAEQISSWWKCCIVGQHMMFVLVNNEHLWQVRVIMNLCLTPNFPQTIGIGGMEWETGKYNVT